MEELFEYVVENCYNGYRVDKLLPELREELSRSFIQKLIEQEKLTIDGKAVKASFKVSEGQKLVLELPEPEEYVAEPEDIHLDILYEDDDVILVNKPKNMVVHPAAGHYSGTLVNALLYHCKDSLSGINGVMRPGIVHRIDQNTTGVLVVCKNDKAHQNLSEQLKVHSITRKYECIVCNAFKEPTGRIEGTIGRHPTDRKKMAINVKNGKPAVTHYRVIENYGNQYSRVECTLETGRTHQIRVHMTSINHPLLGDDVYGRKENPYHLIGQTLHAKVLGFIHPTTGKYVEFEAPLPDYFTELIEKLKRQYGCEQFPEQDKLS